MMMMKKILKKTRIRDRPEEDEETKANCVDDVKKTRALDRSKNDYEMNKRDAGCYIMK